MAKKPDKQKVIKFEPTYTEFRFDDTEPEKSMKLAAEIAEDKDSMTQLTEGLRLMVIAKDLENQAKELIDRASEFRVKAEDMLAPLHLSYGMRGAVSDYGNLSFYYGTQSRLDKKRLQEELVKAKVPLQVITKAMSSATKTTTNNKLSMQLVPVKEEQ